MVPRADIVAVALDVTLGELLARVPDRRPFAPAGLSARRSTTRAAWSTSATSSTIIAARAERADAHRKPRRQLDLASARPVGVAVAASTSSATGAVRAALDAGLDLLVKMQATRIHMALVIDEYGGTDGLVSIEDLVERSSATSRTSMTRRRPA